jgi:hypothetical protein
MRGLGGGGARQQFGEQRHDDNGCIPSEVEPFSGSFIRT